jgi:hypothetical protein
MLVEVAHGAGFRFGKILFNVVAGKHGPGGKVAVFDGSEECQCGWAEAGHVEKFYCVCNGAGRDDAVGVAGNVVVDCFLLVVKFDAPQAGALFAVSFAVSGEDGFCVELDGDVGLFEDYFAAIVA